MLYLENLKLNPIIYPMLARDTLMSIAKHYETGENLPEDVYLKLLAARTFRAGSLSLRQVSVIYGSNCFMSQICSSFCSDTVFL